MGRTGDEQGESPTGPDAGGFEKRRFARMALNLAVNLSFQSAEEAQQSRTVNISPSGVFVRMVSPRPVGTRVRMRLTVAGREMAIGGCVARSIDDDVTRGIGVEFTDIRPDDRAYLELLFAAPAADRARSGPSD